MVNHPPNQGLNDSIQFLKGVGPKRGDVLENEGIETVLDVLYHFPRRHLDRTSVTSLRNLTKDVTTTVVVKVEAGGIRTARKRKYFQLIVSDETGRMNCVWFNGVQYVRNAFSPGDRVAFHGKVEFYNGYQMVHPEYDKIGDEEDDPLHTAAIIPLYPSTQPLKSVGLDSRGFRKIEKEALIILENNPVEFLPDIILKEYGMMPLSDSLKFIHFAPGLNELKQAVSRLKFDEHFFLQLLMALKKMSIQELQGRAFTKTGLYVKLIYDFLDFELTKAQKRVLKEIHEDLVSPHVMNRLLQGDVGSGKTVVAILASAIAVGNGVVVAVMAPTEILAHQHFQVFKSYCNRAQIPVAILVGKQGTKERKNILEGINDGKIKIIIGTHALIQEAVQFKDLGFVIIDEQQRFGVMQRGTLLEKGYNPDVLVMTATPIPRTMAITYHGDLDLSIIDEMPKERKPVITKVVTEERLQKVYQFITDEVEKGRQCMVVYPLIEESEKLDLKAAEEGFNYLSQKVFPKYTLALLHGRMKKEEKDAIMDKFSGNEIQILVSTTIIEVGIDVPNATVMLIENAERFGLTQLHQLRGRVGRGKERGVCILIQRKFTPTGMQRLNIMKRTNNGFEISDEDLKLRGPGEFYGTKQHGFLKWKIADLVKDGPIIRQARRTAFDLVKSDPQLRKPDHSEIRKRFLKTYQHMLEFVNIG